MQRKFVETSFAAMKGEREKVARCGSALSALLLETHGRLGGDGTKLLRDLVTTAAANGRAVQLVCGWTMANPTRAGARDS